MAKLTPKERIFVAEYARDKNGARAARAAGYSAKGSNVTGSHLLAKPIIRAAVDAVLARQAAKAEVSADRVIQRIAQIAFNKRTAADTNILKACELLGKHFKLFTDVSEVSGKDGRPVQVVIGLPDNGFGVFETPLAPVTTIPESEPDGA